MTGIYKIINTQSGKFYIGSSYNILRRFSQHINDLKNNTHSNNHLQLSFNKYGIQSFSFSILEECDSRILLEREQYYLDNIDNWKCVYNKTKISTGGGSDVLRKPVYLLDLDINIVKKFNSGSECAIYLGKDILTYSIINTWRTTKGKYRIVTPEFYEQNMDLIKSWGKRRRLKSEEQYKKSLAWKAKQDKYRCKAYNDQEEFIFNNIVELGKFLNLTREGARQALGKKYHKKSGYYLDYIV